jgi:hypothetical protein
MSVYQLLLAEAVMPQSFQSVVILTITSQMYVRYEYRSTGSAVAARQPGYYPTDLCYV